ncbi:MAG TPA: hypothetical protein VEX35_03545 [Allosphingosinicella sp.]|nr:hypothetical protein [Allosphingosinicella sp.]
MILATLLLLAAAPLPAAIPNPGFERGLEGWTAEGNRGFRASSVSRNPGGGPRRLSMAWWVRSMAQDEAQFRVGTRIDARRYRGRRIRISASVRVHGGARGVATIFARAGALEAVTRLEPGRAWERRSVDLAVPRSAREISLGFHIQRAGVSIEADDVMLEVLR